MLKVKNKPINLEIMAKRKRESREIGLEKRRIISKDGHIGSVRILLSGIGDKRHYAFLFHFRTLPNGRVMAAIRKQFHEIRHPSSRQLILVMERDNEISVTF